ncbi:MAG: DNA repair protein RecO [Pseudomonadota bacterium]
MEWTAQGTLCAVRRHGENGVIAQLFTAEHGLVSGYVPGGAGRRLRPVLEPGNEVKARWRARLADHLGTLQVELVQARAAQVMGQPLRLAAMMSLLGVLSQALPERESFPGLKETLEELLALFVQPALPVEAIGPALVRYEIDLLSALGFALDLRHCAATGGVDDLIYVSPKTGRAVSAEAGAPYRDKLLTLPQFLLGRQAGDISYDSVRDGLALSGFFLESWVFQPRSKALPAARERFVQLLLRAMAPPNAP